MDETTKLTLPEEVRFQQWIKDSGIKDANEPDSYYDYRGAYKAGVKPDANQHWPDTFKQHGHPTFSVESQYSTGQNDGGRWEGDKFIPPRKPMADDKEINRDLTQLDGVKADALKAAEPGPNLRSLAEAARQDPKNPAYDPNFNQTSPNTNPVGSNPYYIPSPPQGIQPDVRQTGVEYQTLANQQYQDSLLKQKESVDKQAEILQKGSQVADQLTRTRQVSDFISGSQIADLQKVATQDAATRSLKLQKDAESLRNEKPDPNKWFQGHGGTAGSILAAISIGLGAFGAAVPHTAAHENYALSIINSAINRDVDSQKEAIDNKWKSLAFQGDENQKSYARDQYQLAALRDARLIDYNHAGAMIDSQIAQTNDASKIAGLQKMKTDVDSQIKDLTTSDIQHRMDVLTKVRADQIAQSNANASPYGDVASMRAYLEYYKKTTDASEAAMSYGDWAAGRAGKGAKATKVSPGQQHLPNQPKADEMQSMFDKLEAPSSKEFTNPLDNLGLGTAAAQAGINQEKEIPGSGALTKRVLGKQSANLAAIEGVNLQIASTLGNTLKDSEGRVPPAIIALIERNKIDGNDTPETARAAVRAIRDGVREQLRQSGMQATDPNAPPPGATKGFGDAGTK